MSCVAVQSGTWFNQGGTFLTATGAPVKSQGPLEVKFKFVDVHGETITVRRPILSVSRLVGKGFAVVMGNDHGNKLSKNGREQIQWCVSCPSVSVVGDLPTGGSRSTDAAPPAEAAGEANVPWTQRLPYKPTEDERMSHSVGHLPFRAWCSHFVKGLAHDWPHRSDCGPPPDLPMIAMEFCFVNTESDDDVLTILAMEAKPFQSVAATVLPDKSASEFAVATIIGNPDIWVPSGGHGHE